MTPNIIVPHLIRWVTTTGGCALISLSGPTWQSAAVTALILFVNHLVSDALSWARVEEMPLDLFIENQLELGVPTRDIITEIMSHPTIIQAVEEQQ